MNAESMKVWTKAEIIAKLGIVKEEADEITAIIVASIKFSRSH